eukprot:CAMPEP_0169458388 /NCGR_PEP_ID=MMETSP1042-20121227/17410_1 /TAXON_ID=464988 /ORGANISM="Hemiselmis andersenii, Strain CCMP1180" /LENGTH=70 /DNA_ID=CAMNT_0009570775 /DNA_START=24 /DNA_END=233 /DNA_ORIENTATION=+
MRKGRLMAVSLQRAVPLTLVLPAVVALLAFIGPAGATGSRAAPLPSKGAPIPPRVAPVTKNEGEGSSSSA